MTDDVNPASGIQSLPSGTKISPLRFENGVPRPRWAHFGEMTWPLPDEGMGELEWRLRYSEPTKTDLLTAASIISAYSQMVSDPASKRARVIRSLREAQRA